MEILKGKYLKPEKLYTEASLPIPGSDCILCSQFRQTSSLYQQKQSGGVEEFNGSDLRKERHHWHRPFPSNLASFQLCILPAVGLYHRDL